MENNLFNLDISDKIHDEDNLKIIATKTDTDLDEVVEIYNHVKNMEDVIKIAHTFETLKYKEMTHSFELGEYYDELKSREIIINGKVNDKLLVAFVNYCISQKGFRDLHKFNERPFDLDMDYFRGGDLKIQFTEKMKHKLFEGYRVNSSGDLIYPNLYTK